MGDWQKSTGSKAMNDHAFATSARRPVGALVEIFEASDDPIRIPTASVVEIRPMISAPTDRDSSSKVTDVMSKKLPRFPRMLFKVRESIAGVCQMKRNPAMARVRKGTFLNSVEFAASSGDVGASSGNRNADSRATTCPTELTMKGNACCKPYNAPEIGAPPLLD